MTSAFGRSRGQRSEISTFNVQRSTLNAQQKMHPDIYHHSSATVPVGAPPRGAISPRWMLGVDRWTLNVETDPARRAAFTLTELLVSITIIAILLGLLYGAIRTVSRYSRETITRGELSNIEAAWKHYYNYYHAWPTNDVESAGSSISAAGFRRFDNSDGDVQYELGPYLASMLAGDTNNSSTIGLNTDGVAFLDFTRFDSTAAPISAWGPLRGQRYFVKLDVSGDNQLTVPIDTNNHTTNIFRRVAVWTANPDRSGILIGSWMQ